MSTESARATILAAVRRARPASVDSPDLGTAVTGLDQPAGDLTAAFVIAAVASGAHVVQGAMQDVPRLVSEVAPDARRIVSVVPGVASTVILPDDGHLLADLDVFVCEAGLGVAENGAVWLPASHVGQRAALFLAAHVVVILDRSTIVAHLHAAYARLDLSAQSFAVFVAGPSKTADIEQSLVIGAQGPGDLTLILV